MKTRPLSVTIVSCLLVLAGAGGFVAHYGELRAQHFFQHGSAAIILVEFIAVICGVYMLRGQNWARWVAILWLAFHVIISGFDSLQKLGIHALLFAVFAYFLFRREATNYFRNTRVQAT